jgi:hypothetical protein
MTARLRYQPSSVDRPMPSAAMSARLMTARPLMSTPPLKPLLRLSSVLPLMSVMRPSFADKTWNPTSWQHVASSSEQNNGAR